MSKKQENAHIPKYIKDQPWFYKDSNDSPKNEDYLAHHRRSKIADTDLDIDNNAEPKVGRGIKDEYERISSVEPSNRYIFRRENCANCGVPGHVARDCLEPPKKRGLYAKTASEKQVERRVEFNDNWDARKDRWYGYEGKEYDTVLRQKQEELKRKEAETKRAADEVDTDEEIELSKLGLYKQETSGNVAQDDAQGSKLRASVRLREDRAAYLKDIGSDTLNYDPKSRLYKTDDLGEIDPESKMFHRHLTGESLELSQLNRFAREQTLRSGIRDEIENAAKTKHVLVANPTKYELLMKQEGSIKTPASGEQLPTSGSAKKISGTKQTQEEKAQLLKKYG
ncbi:LAME_0G09692g1_1 [Lachancea meyersii CBS 8951]|uniref:Pre-mRNA-splicing factor SLU7 n=1 Tax=Lachancea meyersii CBS 8951 TaxID=1266667 RepID=A0A1G4K8R6_9SACH|nr:LAME_0G09692g1_1 [Lachancea meyersii CBS 8951]